MMKQPIQNRRRNHSVPEDVPPVRGTLVGGEDHRPPFVPPTDEEDFVLLHNRYVKAGKEHCGIIVSKQLPLSMVLATLLALMSRHSQASLRHRLMFL